MRESGSNRSAVTVKRGPRSHASRGRGTAVVDKQCRDRQQKMELHL